MTAPPGELPALRTDLLRRFSKVTGQLNTADVQRQLFEGFRDDWLDRYPEADNTFLRYYAYAYNQTQVMTIRRLADTDADSDSLHTVINRIRKNPELASKRLLIDRVRAERGDEWADMESRTFTTHFGEGDLPDDEPLAELQAQLAEVTANSKIYADRAVAHFDKKGIPEDYQLTYDELHDTLGALRHIANRIQLLLESSTTMSKVAINGDWHEAFRGGFFHLE